ncbi:DUF1120 domain-containing protein [Chromobacterium sp. Beijing]|uniref:DUF1120 domain-containing protein n=1 Tax=Chromobacterium sp. Beijing TaxID=2735795 RepID=UPI001F3D3B5D|nr:DUF1120 domain-containing protein [Chromobacterium sp. Beijing]UJB31158.1 DUF1120 domain-containing protein [Chromobacterium sp. Beijing]
MKYRQAIVAALCASMPVLAANTPFALTAEVVPPSCTPGFSHNGVVDYGLIPWSALNPGATLLGEREISLHVQCDQPALVGLSIRDNRGDSRAGIAAMAGLQTTGAASPSLPAEAEQTLGLGRDSRKQGLGYWWLSLIEAHADERPAMLMRSAGRQEGWSQAGGEPLNLRYGYALGSPQRQALQPAGTHVFKLRVGAALRGRQALSAREPVRLDGHATVTVFYP